MDFYYLMPYQTRTNLIIYSDFRTTGIAMKAALVILFI